MDLKTSLHGSLCLEILSYTKKVADTICSFFQLTNMSNFFFDRMIENYDNIKRLMIDYPTDDYTRIATDRILLNEVINLTRKLERINVISSSD